ncbi:uncharacterized protein LOC115311472 [Ixodes scapularis]|uniref:uncharacterized protein LOC115311472 n=1 Tax=Ixodes scapularis TaxID=6945 RepID=UPI001A9D848D|nr:uncharacterized protein LOC115311472 [Ixodes scapularis]
MPPQKTKRRRASSVRYCCVKGCHNREGLAGVKLHRFPSRPWEQARRQRWINAVRRVNDDGSNWSPNESSRICSTHFLNNELSNIENHPGYYPTLFPEVYRKKSVDPEAQLGRFSRWQERSACSGASAAGSSGLPSTGGTSPVPSEHDSDSSGSPQRGLELLCEAVELREKCSVEIQTDELGTCSRGFTVFTCSLEGGAGCTQITHREVCDFGTQHQPELSSKYSGPSERTSFFGGYESIRHSEDALQGICNVSMSVFALFLSMLPLVTERSCDVTLGNRLLLFLMKMKLGLSYTALGVIFSVNRTTASRHFRAVLTTLTAATARWIFRPPSSIIRATLPECFKVNYPECKMIIDCTEVRTEEPSSVGQQRVLYSSYKSGYTLKFLVAVTPNGAICFRSKAYGGRCSDIHVTVDSGFLNIVQPGDVILADKGFPGIRAGLADTDAVLVMPPFLSGNGQFSEQEVRDTYDIAQVRIHVERMIQRIKIYNILRTTVPITLIPLMDDVFHMCCVLANLQPAIIKPQE